MFCPGGSGCARGATTEPSTCRECDPACFVETELQNWETNGKARNPSSIDAPDIKWKAPTPSTERTAAAWSRSVSLNHVSDALHACYGGQCVLERCCLPLHGRVDLLRDCACDQQPKRVPDLPRMPPEGLRRAVILPRRRRERISTGTSPMIVRDPATTLNLWQNPTMAGGVLPSSLWDLPRPLAWNTSNSSRTHHDPTRMLPLVEGPKR